LRLLIIGGGGQLGSKLAELAKDRFEVYATYLTRRPPIGGDRALPLDKRDRDRVFALFGKLRPDVVIDTGALHNVDYCETHRSEAWGVNVDGTRNLAEACEAYGAKMVFVSTDYVFDGAKGNYSEEEAPNPVNYYGLTKLEGERAVARACARYAIARPSVIYGYVPPSQGPSSSGKPLNFALWLIQKLENGEPVKIVTDQYSSPTLADSLAEALLRLAESEETGVFHIAGKSRLNRYEFALKIAEKLGLDAGLISPITTDQLKQIAKRPMDSSLNVEKVEKRLGLKMLSIDEALKRFEMGLRSQ
jgi:dTDP-4-dehydrorhamnose reductase